MRRGPAASVDERHTHVQCTVLTCEAKKYWIFIRCSSMLLSRMWHGAVYRAFNFSRTHTKTPPSVTSWSIILTGSQTKDSSKSTQNTRNARLCQTHFVPCTCGAYPGYITITHLKGETIRATFLWHISVTSHNIHGLVLFRFVITNKSVVSVQNGWTLAAEKHFHRFLWKQTQNKELYGLQTLPLCSRKASNFLSLVYRHDFNSFDPQVHLCLSSYFTAAINVGQYYFQVPPLPVYFSAFSIFSIYMNISAKFGAKVQVNSLSPHPFLSAWFVKNSVNENTVFSISTCSWTWLLPTWSETLTIFKPRTWYVHTL